MNKKLLAIAVGAAMVAGSAAAMADATVYGKVHVSVDSLDNGASGSVATGSADNSGLYLSSNSSRLGIKGSEDLGDGLSAIYKYELTTSYTSASDNISGNRNAYLGLKGGFGTVLAGRHDTPYKTVGRKSDMFGDTIADARNLTNDGGQDARVDNVLVYANSFGAVDLALAYVLDDGVKDAGANGLSLGFKQGPLKLAAALQNVNKAAPAAKDSSAYRITAGYMMGAATINANYESETDAGGVAGNDSTGWGLGAAFKAGMNTFKATYQTRDNDLGTKDTGTLMALGVDHKLGKNTKVYAIYASMSNDSGANFRLGGSGHDKNSRPGGAAAGEDGSGFSLGMITKF